MTDDIAQTARLMNVIDAIVDELDRQGVVYVLADTPLDVKALAKAVLKAADGDVVELRPPRRD